MYTIQMNSNKSLTATNRVTLFEKETNVDTIRWLIPPQYTEGATVKNIIDYVVTVKVKCPDGRGWVELLECEDVLYKERLDYRMPVTSDLTQVAGTVTMYLTFTRVVELEDGTKTSDVFHSYDINIQIQKKEEFIFIPDKTLQAVDQLILKISNEIDRVENIVSDVNNDKAEDIEIIDGQIWLTRKDPETGETILLGDPISASSHVWQEL